MTICQTAPHWPNAEAQFPLYLVLNINNIGTYITHLMNLCLQQGTFPCILKKLFGSYDNLVSLCVKFLSIK